MARLDEKVSSLGELPVALLTVIMSHTTPLDVARLATLNRSFAEAARCETLWRKFLPADFKDIVLKAHGGPIAYNSFKCLYDRLGDHVLLGDGNEGYWIDRKTGGVHRSYSSRKLRIAWGDSDAEYWEWIQHRGSRFSEVAFLREVCWLDLSGEISTRLPPGTYILSWILKLHGLSYGWESSSVISTVTDGIMHHQAELEWSFADDYPEPEPNERWLRWSEYDMGQFTVERGDDPNFSEVNLRFRMQEISRLNWKSGMYVDGVIIRPANEPAEK